MVILCVFSCIKSQTGGFEQEKKQPHWGWILCKNAFAIHPDIPPPVPCKKLTDKTNGRPAFLLENGPSAHSLKLLDIPC